MKALILIGGMGTRLRPLTCTTPKPLLPIVNRPFLEYQFELLKRHGINEVILCVAYLSDEFKKYFGTGKKWGMKLHYVHEENPLGTGGAIRNASKFIDDTVLIFNGDILTDINLSDMVAHHKNKKALITIALTRVKDPTMYGLVEIDKTCRIERFLEKPSWDEINCNTINAGIYLFEPEALEYIPEGINFSVERGLFPNLLAKGNGLYGFTSKSYWMDIGTVDKYLQSHDDVISHSVNFSLPGKKRFKNIWAGQSLKWGKHNEINGTLVCGNNVIVGDFVQFHGNVSLGNNVTIGQGSSISGSVILNSVSIGEGVRMDRSLIGSNCVIEANVSLNPYTTLGNETIIRKYSKL